MEMWNKKYHEKHKVFSLYGHLLDYNRLFSAWTKVKQNQGAGGIDQITIEMFDGQHDLHLKTLQQHLQEKTYCPHPVRRVQIEKDGSDKLRNLGIPTILDRVVQQVLKDLLEPIFDPFFSEHSFGYRPGRSTHDALRVVKNLREQYDWIVDADIKGFFDNVNHDILLDLVNERMSDGSILRLLRSILQSGVYFEGEVYPTEQGTPQGGVISPLLANIYLNHLDRRLEEMGYSFVRYADDLLIFCPSREEAQSALAFVEIVLSKELLLELNHEKTKLCHISRDDDPPAPLGECRPFEFLGFRIHKWWMIPTERSVQRFKNKIRRLTIRHYKYANETWMHGLNAVIRGWGNYFRIGTVKTLFKRLSRWIRIRIRLILGRRRHWKVRYNRRWLSALYGVYPNSFLMKMGFITLDGLLSN
jgi:group II intron reverse transcriptase/maturase